MNAKRWLFGVVLFILTFTPALAQEGDIYIDNRSDPTAVLQSLFNAVNRREYVRAYSYWEADSPDLEPYPQFEAGYADTDFVQLITGDVTGDAGAGQVYYNVPVMLISQLTNGATQVYVGCYTLHQSQPANFGEPPFRPLAIASADIRPAANSDNAAAQLSSACAAGGSPITITPPGGAIDASVYVDDRSDAVSVLQSLFNAVNRREYVRAYSYWEANSPDLGPYPQFEAGYADTASVELIAGDVVSDAGAGQLYYNVPVTLISQLPNGATQVFVGCYTLHLSQPAVQGTPPFQPLAIASADIRQVAGNADAAPMMAQVCA